MTHREQEIVDLIRSNPMISQNELAEKLSITRSSVAVHITNLMKKGVICGKRYVLSEEPYICVIGGASVDIQGFPSKELIFRDYNPGTVNISLGGVGRNIAENLSKLGERVKLITAVGNDTHGKDVLENAKIAQIDVTHTLISEELPTAVYLSLQGADGDMLASIAQMDVIEKIAPDYLMHRAQLIRGAQLCVLDTNLSTEAIASVASILQGAQLYMDVVSTAKAGKIRGILPAIHTLRLSGPEASKLSGIEIADENSLRKNGAFFLSQGVRRVVIFLGAAKIYYMDENLELLYKPKNVRMVSVTGAENAFMAGLIYGSIHGLDAEKQIDFSAAAAKLAMAHEKAIHPHFSVPGITALMENTAEIKWFPSSPPAN